MISGTDVDYKQLESGKVQLPVNRTLYLNELLKRLKNTQITKDKEYKNIVNQLDKELIDEDEKIPEKLNAKLREYQRMGYKWLKTLDLYKFGGVLADDMGLGKTIQIIALLLDCKEKEGHKTSLVVSPSSLALNWKNEVEKFAPELKIKVISGNAEERKDLINDIENMI